MNAHDDFSIVENNNQFLVINKHHNVDFHCENGEQGIVVSAAKHINIDKLFPVHRLDKMTSGLLILAKSSDIAAKFGVLFEQRLIEKYYISLSDKKPKKKQGLIKGDMSKGRNGSYLLLKTTSNPAITQFFSYLVAPGLRLFLLKPHTGKTHQLRVAMKSIGAPIIGDNRYYPNNTQPIGLLHAWQLAFELDGMKFRFHALPNWQHEGLGHLLDNIEDASILAWPKL